MQKTTSKIKNANGKYDLYTNLQHVKDALADVTRDATGKASYAIHQSLNDAKKKSASIHKNVNSYIIEKPLKSLGFAMLAGMIIGYYFHRK